jgi:tellurite resistance protein
MGLAGLGLACRGAAPVVKQPPAFSEVWVAAGALVMAVLLLALLFRMFSDFKAIREELNDPARLGFCATLPIGLTLVAGGLQPYAIELARLVWWCGALLLFALQVWALARWLHEDFELAHVNGGWMIVMIGGIVMPTAGVPLGEEAMARVMFGVSAAATPIVMGMVFWRSVVGPRIADALRPAWFIFLVPSSLIYLNGAALVPGEPGLALEAMFFSTLVLVPALLIASRGFLRWPFTRLWWAFTFPLDAVAAAAAHYARSHPGGPWPAITGAALLLALFFVVLAIYKTLRSIFPA